MDDLASKSNMHFKMSAILVKGGKILAVGHNYGITLKKPRRPSADFSIHAEMMCLHKALHHYGDGKIKNAEMVIYKQNREGNGNSKPCKVCQKLLKKHKIKVKYAYEGIWHEKQLGS
jgi:cytidine deaminase